MTVVDGGGAASSDIADNCAYVGSIVDVSEEGVEGRAGVSGIEIFEHRLQSGPEGF